jgi:serine/threonine-protein kinase
MATLADGQKLLAAGDGEGALHKFKEAQDQGAGSVAKGFLEQVKIGVASSGPCKMVGFSHPHLAYGGNIGRPAISSAPNGAIVVWTDDHEQAGHDHTYSVVIDGSGRLLTRPRDLTPEADNVMRPSLLAVDDRNVLLFWDKSGREPGVRVRWLDADGRIDAMSVLVSASRPGSFWPAMDRAPDGSFWVAWQDSREKETDNLFLRHLGADLQPTAPEIRATDYQVEKGKVAHASAPSVAVSSANLFVAYALERDKQHLIERMRLALGAPELGTGLDEKAFGAPLPGGGTQKPKDRELGEVSIANEDKVGGDYPAMACVKDGCFLVWHEAKGGAQAALIDPVKGVVTWRKRFAPKGGHPALATNADGQVEVAYYEQSRVRVATLSRDGVGTTSTFAKISGDQPRPWIAPGRAKGEWYVAWLDVEASHTEAYAVRLACRN